jgi:hypothetical protein
MAPVAAFVGTYGATISTVATVAGGLYSANVARQGRRDTQAAQARQQDRIKQAEERKKKARLTQETRLGERRRERSAEGFGSTIVAGKAKSLGGSGTGGQSLLG